MTQFKYPHFLLGSVVAGLWFAGEAYATQSPLTPGPSVGHRPVINKFLDISLGGYASITSTKYLMGTGNKLTLISSEGGFGEGPKGIDVDGDVDKTGGYCVWYKVPAGGGTPVVIQDRGPADRDCSYTVQMSDVGFKIKADITIFSDADKALAKGYTINPIESISSEIISANAVAAPYFDIWLGPTKFFDKGDGFPTIGFGGAEFTMRVHNGATMASMIINSYYDWHTTDNAVASVSDEGVITLHSPSANEITIEAVSKSTGDKLVYKFQLKHWISKYIGPRLWSPSEMNNADDYCKKQGGTVTSVEILTDATKPDVPGTVKKIGILTGEWGWSGQPAADPQRIMTARWIHPRAGYPKTIVSGGDGYIVNLTNSPPHQSIQGNYLCHIKL